MPYKELKTRLHLEAKIIYPESEKILAYTAKLNQEEEGIHPDDELFIIPILEFTGKIMLSERGSPHSIIPVYDEENESHSVGILQTGDYRLTQDGLTIADREISRLIGTKTLLTERETVEGFLRNSLNTHVHSTVRPIRENKKFGEYVIDTIITQNEYDYEDKVAFEFGKMKVTSRVLKY